MEKLKINGEINFVHQGSIVASILENKTGQTLLSCPKIDLHQKRVKIDKKKQSYFRTKKW